MPLAFEHFPSNLAWAARGWRAERGSQEKRFFCPTDGCILLLINVLWSVLHDVGHPWRLAHFQMCEKKWIITALMSKRVDVNIIRPKRWLFWAAGTPEEHCFDVIFFLRSTRCCEGCWVSTSVSLSGFRGLVRLTRHLAVGFLVGCWSAWPAVPSPFQFFVSFLIFHARFKTALNLQHFWNSMSDLADSFLI